DALCLCLPACPRVSNGGVALPLFEHRGGTVSTRFRHDAGGRPGAAGGILAERARARRMAGCTHRTGTRRLCSAAPNGGRFGFLSDPGAPFEDQARWHSDGEASAARNPGQPDQRLHGSRICLHNPRPGVRRHVGVYRVGHAVDRRALPQALDDLKRQPGLLEGMILSTCNRVEVTVTADEQADAEGSVELFLAESRSVERAWVTQYLYRHDGPDAIRHLFRVASS